MNKRNEPKWTEEQIQAIYTRNNNILVSAGAGSGKTAVLSERVLQLVKEGISIDELIILTFTNSAAAEMKERIRNKLIENSNDNEWIATNVLKIDQSFIMTFDSFCLYLVKKYNYLFNINSSVGIIDNISSKLKKEELMLQLIENKIENDDQQMLSFLQNYSNIAIDEIIILFLRWYNPSIANVSFEKNISDIEIFELYEKNILEKVSEVNELVAKILILAEDTKLVDIISERCNILKSVTSYDQVCVSIESIFETRFWSIPRGDFAHKDEVKKLNDQLKNLLKKLKEKTKYSGTQNVEFLKQISETKKYIDAILNEFNNNYEMYKKQINRFEFIDINLMAIELVKTNPDIRNLLKDNTYEIMIDEYQDTNDIQEKFISYIANNNVYMVGDVKQSIYAFRNANPDLFTAKYKLFSSTENGKLITLTNNFRSRKNVLNMVNDLFSAIMSNSLGGITYDQNQQMNYGNKNYDLLEQNTNEIITYSESELAIDKNDFEIIQIFKDIKNKVANNYQVVDGNHVRNVKYSDFAILCSTREKFNRITQIGEFYKISVDADIFEQFISSAEISVVQSLLNVLSILKTGVDNEQKFIFYILQIARSYLFYYADDEIDNAINSLQKIKSTELNKRMYALSQGPLNEVYKILRKISKDIEFKSTKYTLEECLEQFSIVEKLDRLDNPHIRQLRIAKLEQLIFEYESLNYDLETICTLLNKVEISDDLDIDFIDVQDTQSDSVKVTTIHKAKGLEYNICYFPFLFKKFNKMDIYNNFLYSKKYEYVLPALLENKNLVNTVTKDLIYDETEMNIISEKIRVLYVALTRAKDKNVLILNIDDYDNNKYKQINKANSLNDLLFNGWDALKAYKQDCYNLLDAEIELSKYNKFNQPKDELNQNVIEKKYIEIKEEAKILSNKRASSHISTLIDNKIANNIDLGNYLHNKLEFCDLFNIDKELNEANDQLKIALKNLKQSNLLNSMINYYPEFQIKYTVDFEINGIIDLLVEFDDKFIIIDYKLYEINKTEYYEQVMTYVDYIEKITNKKVEGYLLSLLNGNVIKVK